MAGMGMKLVAMILVLLVAAGPLSPQAMAQASPRTAGCHSIAHYQSSLRTVDHDCCQSGHNSALVKAAVDSVPSLPVHPSFEIIPALSFSLSQPSRAISSSGGPPISPPLLI